MNFAETLIAWYNVHKRDLPWRDTSDPYRIWLSEIILQQTRVAQGLPYFESFLKSFPTVEDLAEAPLEKVLKLWQGLGYYSRARNLHAAAKQVVERGSFPKSFRELLELKGVGEYTAAAIASFAYDEKVAVVDGNVYRVLARYCDIALPINSTEGVKEFKALAQKLISTSDPATYNQAIMEFGALQCVPKNPDCSICPLQKDCRAFQNRTVEIRPVKLKKTKVKKLFHHYLVIQTPDNSTILQRRADSGIWAGLYEFPFIESNGAMLPNEIVDNPILKDLIGKAEFGISAYNQQPIIHLLSHRKIHAYFWIIKTNKQIAESISIKEAKALPVHKLMENLMSEYWKAD